MPDSGPAWAGLGVEDVALLSDARLLLAQWRRLPLFGEEAEGAVAGVIARIDRRLGSGDVPVGDVRGEYRDGGARVCPTPCDDDCEAVCHEQHQIPRKRSHELSECPGSSVT